MAQTLQPKNTASRLLAVGTIPICDKCLGSWRLHSLQRPGSAGVHVHTDSQHTWKHWDSKTWGTFLELDFYLLIFHMDRCKGSSRTLVWHFNSSSLTTVQTQTAFPAHKQPSLWNFHEGTCVFVPWPGSVRRLYGTQIRRHFVAESLVKSTSGCSSSGQIYLEVTLGCFKTLLLVKRARNELSDASAPLMCFSCTK